MVHFNAKPTASLNHLCLTPKQSGNRRDSHEIIASWLSMSLKLCHRASAHSYWLTSLMKPLGQVADHVEICTVIVIKRMEMAEGCP